MASEFVWQSEDRATAIHLSLEAVDGILFECMRGLGAVPKRGAEVGGVLLGSAVREGGKLRIAIDDFEAVPIEYKHGPSYIFSEDDVRLFADTMTRLKSHESPRPVGFFRANTREEMDLSSDDIGTLEEHFADAGSVVLLIRPYTTRPSMAGFVLPHKDGSYAAGMAPASEFPFRRREIEEMLEARSAPAGPRTPYRPFAVPAPQAAPAPAAAIGTAPAPEASAAPAATASMGPISAALHASMHPPAPQPAQPPIEPAAPVATPKRRVWWSALPLSSMFLAVGILLGIQATLSFMGMPADPYDLKLALSRNGSTLTLAWDRHAPAIRSALRGSVLIEDGSARIPKDLSATELQTGSIVYTPITSSVHFRLQVFPKERDSIAETIDWNQ